MVEKNKDILKGHVFYIIGDDTTSRINEANSLVDKILGEQDRSLCVETFDLADADTDELRTSIVESAVSSLISPPFLTPFRIVILREISSATNDNVVSLIQYLQDPVDTSYLIAVQGGGRISAQLTKAWKPLVTQIGSSNEKAVDVFSKAMKENNISFGPGVRDMVMQHFGEDATKINDFFRRLTSIYGGNVKLELEQIKDYLGESGNLAFYELANKVSAGDTKSSLEIVSRMMHTTSSSSAKPMHPLQIVSLLASHFRKLGTVDSPDVKNQNDAHRALGSKGSPYAAKMSLDLSRRLGTKAILECIELLGSLDVSIKGANAIDAEIAIEVGIVSLCQICSSGNLGSNRNDLIENLYIS